MIIMQIVKVSLVEGADRVLSAYDYGRVKEYWDSNTSWERSIEAVVCDTREEGLRVLAKDLARVVEARWARSSIKPEHFQFGVSYQEVEDGRFWMPSGVMWSRWHKVKDYLS